MLRAVVWLESQKLAMSTVVLAALCAGGCVDARDFAGTWTGPRVGDATVLSVGFADNASATLEVTSASLRSIRGSLTTSGDEFVGSQIQELAPAQADVLSELSYGGSEAAVFVVFVTPAAGEPATAFVSLESDDRIELRVLRAGSSPLYGAFDLRRVP